MTCRSPMIQRAALAPPRELHLAFASTPRSVRAALAAILDRLADLALSDDDRGALEIVLAEVLNNIVEHAYAESPDGRIELTVRPSVTHITCEVLDGGEPMPGGRVPEPAVPALSGDDAGLPEGGFGWSLIRLLCVELRYAREGGRNRLTLRLERSGAPR